MFGTPLCLIGGHLISSQLYKTKGNDPVVLMSATLLLMAGARIAGFIPARRAASIDPCGHSDRTAVLGTISPALNWDIRLITTNT